jgi:hypothetical protein
MLNALNKETLVKFNVHDLELSFESNDILVSRESTSRGPSKWITL